MTDARLGNVVYDALDRRVALGGAEDVIAFEDARLTRADLLDRVAKVAGILHAVGVEAGGGVRVDLAGAGVTRAIAVLAVWRLGAVVDAAAATRIDTQAPAASGPEIHGAFVRGRSRALVSHLEGTYIHDGQDTWDLGALARETGIQPAVAARLPLTQPLLADSALTAADLEEDPTAPGAPSWWPPVATPVD